ncbi:MAG: transcriptional activator NhaR [Sterolibacterium sp.]
MQISDLPRLYRKSCRQFAIDPGIDPQLWLILIIMNRFSCLGTSCDPAASRRETGCHLQIMVFHHKQFQLPCKVVLFEICFEKNEQARRDQIMNLKHLYYFWKTAKCGGVVRAAKAMSLTPQTVSGQLRQLEESLGTQLFLRAGRSMALTASGQLAMDYANEMFELGAELELALRQQLAGLPITFHIGVSDAIPKSLAYRLLQPAVNIPEPVRIVCREWRVDRLLSELAARRLDMVIADAPLPSSSNVRTQSLRLGTSGLSFFATDELLRGVKKRFPACLDGLPFLLPGEDSSMRRKLENWLEKVKVRPRIVGEFDDLALLIAFGRSGAGAFAVPTVNDGDTLSGDGPHLLGRTTDICIEYFAITASGKVSHPCVAAITRRSSGNSSPLRT